MNKDSLTRRRFLQKTEIATGAVLGSSLLDVPTAMAGPPYVRTDVGTLSATDPILTSYAAAVAAMRKLDMTDPTDPLGWQYQASIHGTTAASITQGEMDTWNSCQHTNTVVFNTFFLSLHRMYLYYFERIIRKLSGNANWALPYWNYELATERQLPPAFRTPSNVSNPLFVENREPGWNDGSMSLQPSSVSTAIAFADIPFADFCGQLEYTPHSDVHVSVGGLIGKIITAAQDPIFFLHLPRYRVSLDTLLGQSNGRRCVRCDASNLEFRMRKVVGLRGRRWTL